MCALPVSQTERSQPPLWHTLPAEAACRLLDADLDMGLTELKAAHRLGTHGPNAPRGQPVRATWRAAGLEFLQPMSLLLLVTGAVYAGLGNLPAAAYVGVIWVVFITANLLKQRRISDILQAIGARNSPSAIVRREGKRHVIPADEVVPGDLLLLEVGQRVPADARLVQSISLLIDESPLTGATQPAAKDSESFILPGAPPAERRNLVHAGALVLNGWGSALVVATGPDTEYERMPHTPEPPPVLTDRQAALVNLTRQLTGIALAAGMLIPFLAWLLNGVPVEEVLLSGLALAFAILPLAEPRTYTLLLSFGAHKLARRGVIIRRLTIIETLSTLTTVAADKTGTLTVNEPAASRWVPGAWQGPLLELGAAGCILEQRADPLDTALLAAAQEAGINLEAMRRAWPMVALNSFDPTRKRMSAVYRRHERSWAVVRGAPEAILQKCVQRWTADGADVLHDLDRQAILTTVAVLAGAGQRVVALAERRLPPEISLDDLGVAAIETDLVFAGLVAFADPIRSEAAPAVQSLQQAGLRLLILTADHPEAGRYAAAQLGLQVPEHPLTAAELQPLTPPDLSKALEGQCLVTRLTPGTRLAIVQQLQAAGERVAATGAGLSDAPALAAAELGVAMGRGGTDAARQAAGLVLGDNNFHSLVDAIFTGRLVFANSAKALGYALACRFGLGLAVLLPVLFRQPMPFTPLQLLLCGLLIDLMAATIFLTEPAEPGLAQQRPRSPLPPWRDKLMTGRILRGAVAFFTATSAAYFASYLLSGSLPIARAVTFATWLISQVLVAYSLRSDHTLLLRQNLVSNRWLVVWVAVVTGTLVLLQAFPRAAVVIGSTPAGQSIQLQPLDWGLALFTALFGLALAELRKLIGLLAKQTPDSYALQPQRH